MVEDRGGECSIVFVSRRGVYRGEQRADSFIAKRAFVGSLVDCTMLWISLVCDIVRMYE